MSKKALIGVGAGCLGCVGIPALLAIGGAAGWLLANQGRDEIALSELDYGIEGEQDSASTDDESWREESRTERARTNERELAVKPVEKAKPELFSAPVATATPTPVAMRLSIATPAPVATPEKKLEKLAELSAPAKDVFTAPRAVSTPAALSQPISAPKAISTPVAIAKPISTAAPIAALSKPVSTPAPVVALKQAAPGPLPKSTPRKFDDGDELFGAKPAAKSAKGTKVASAAAATASTTNEDDVAVAALFGDEPGSALKPAAAAPGTAKAAEPAATPAPKIKSIKTQNGTIQATIDRQIVVKSADGKTLMGTLSKVEAGWVGVKLADGKVKFVQESEIVEAAEL